MSKHTWLLNPGHGGMINGIYQTPGKRSPRVPPGIYEGEFNRAVVDITEAILREYNVHVINIASFIGPYQTWWNDLDPHIVAANQLANVFDCRFIHVEANAAAEQGWSGAHGHKAFYYPGSKYGAPMARIFSEKLTQFNGTRDRGVERRKYKILRKTSMPAVLLECGFMTNLEEAKRMATDEFRMHTAEAIVAGIMEIENGN